MDWLKVGKSFGTVEKKREKKSKNKIIALAVNDHQIDVALKELAKMKDPLVQGDFQKV